MDEENFGAFRILFHKLSTILSVSHNFCFNSEWTSLIPKKKS